MNIIQINSCSMGYEVVASVPFNAVLLDCGSVVDDGESLYIPYNDRALCDAVEVCMCEIASRNEWVFPDYDTAKIGLVMPMDGQQTHIQLMLKVEPPYYTETEKAYILSSYDMWCDIFDTAQAYNNGNGTKGYSGDTMEIYDIELEPDEIQGILSIVDCLVKS